MLGPTTPNLCSFHTAEGLAELGLPPRSRLGPPGPLFAIQPSDPISRQSGGLSGLQLGQIGASKLCTGVSGDR